MKKAYGTDKAEKHYSTVEAVTETLVSGQLYLRPSSQNPRFTQLPYKIFFCILVSDHLRVRTPFSRPEGVRLRDLPLYCLKEFTYKQIRKLLSYNLLKSRRRLRFYVLTKPICLLSIVLMSKSYREHDLNIRHSFSRTFLILANFCIDTYLILTSFQQVKLLKTKFF